MANLKILKQKEKRFAFTAFGNNEQPRPALAVFKRFPYAGETFYTGMRQDISRNLNIDTAKLSGKERDAELEKVKDQLVKSFIDNLSAGRMDYEAFCRECVDHFEELSADGQKVETVNEFLALPQDAVFIIASELYEYATARDEFSMGESSA